MRFFTFLILALLMLSCSSDDDGGSNSGLLKKVIYTLENGDLQTGTYTYNGNKFSKITYSGENGSSIVHVNYTGDVISEMLYYTDDEAEPIQTETFLYDAQNRLSVYVYKQLEFDLGFKETYVYNDNGTITYSHFDGDAAIQDNLEHTGIIYFTAGEVSSIVEDYPFYSTTTTYEYDSMKNPFVNVTGYNKIYFTDAESDGRMHNVVSADYTNDDDPYTDLSSYTYNEDGFPVTMTGNDYDEEVNVEYIYY